MPDSHTGPHWSKDYVEHIRTVHFTLIAVCVALFLLSTSRAHTDVQIAHEQIRQIREFLGSEQRERQGHYGWLLEGARKAVNEWSEVESRGYRSSDGYIPVTFVSSALEFSYDGTRWQGRLNLMDRDNYLWDSRPRERTDPLPQPFEQRSTQSTLMARPDTLEKFRNLWDLTGHLFLDVPNGLSPKALVFGNHANEDGDFWEPMGLRDSTVVQDLSPVRLGGSLYLNEYPYQQLKHLLAKDPDFRARLNFSGHVYSVENNGATPKKTLDVSIPIPRIASIPYDGQALLISHAKKEWDWKHGTFDYSFRQLSAITREYPTISIETCEQVLTSEEKRGGESFEALGIKFPAENTTRWGILVIIGIQIYFWIHLRELKPKLRRNDPGWDVAWIGVYTSTYARVAMFVLTCLLPLAAALALGIRGLQISSFARTNWALLVFGSAATLILGILAWMRLPRMDESH